MIFKKLAKMPYSNAHVEIDCLKNIYLFSYQTLVATLTYDGWMHINGLYHGVTRKHIGAFISEYVIWPNGEAGTYQEFRKLYDDGYDINIQTGEVIER